VAFLGVGVVTAHLLVRALQAEHGRLRDREARFVLVGAGVLFVVGFAQLVVSVEGAQEGLAAVALGFTAVAYLLYLSRPALFGTSEQDERNGSVDEKTTR
jgi:threonine/homoserine/homoserine lactone efflux protein